MFQGQWSILQIEGAKTFWRGLNMLKTKTRPISCMVLKRHQRNKIGIANIFLVILVCYVNMEDNYEVAQCSMKYSKGIESRGASKCSESFCLKRMQICNTNPRGGGVPFRQN